MSSPPLSGWHKSANGINSEYTVYHITIALFFARVEVMLPLNSRPMWGALIMSSETWIWTTYMWMKYVSVCCVYTWLCCQIFFLPPSNSSSLHPTVRVDRPVHSTRDNDVDVMNCIGSCQCRYSIMEWTSVSHSILIWFTRLCFLGSQDAAGSAKVEETK